MTTEKATEDRSEVRISKILVPVDGSEYSDRYNVMAYQKNLEGSGVKIK